MVESGRVPGKDILRTSIEKLSQRVPKKGSGEYLKRVESVSIPEKGRICASTEKLSGRVWQEGTISVRTEKW